MREAVGGSVLFMIILGFIAVYIVFIAVIMNYAATYRANNYVVNELETSMGEVSKDSLKEELSSRQYNYPFKVTCNSNAAGSVYQVTTYVVFEIPLIGERWHLDIKNETKTIMAACNNEYVEHN